MTVQKPEDTIDFANLSGNTGATAGANTGNPTPKPLDVATIINTFGGSSRGESDAEVTKVHAAVKAVLDQNKENAPAGTADPYVLVSLSSKRTGNFGALALCTARQSNQQTLIFVATLIVEKSRSTPTDMIQVAGYPNQPPIEMFVGAADVFNQAFFQQITDEVVNAYGNKNARVINAGYQVVYDLTSLTPDDLRPMVKEAQSSIDHSIDLLNPDRQIFNISAVASNPALRVRSRVVVDAKKTEPSGLPVRSDIKTDLIISQNNQSKGPIGSNTEVRLCETSAYVDLIYVPTNTMNPYQPQNPYVVAPPSYIPRIVITNFNVELPMSALEFMLLGVAQMVSLANNRAYGVVWRNQFGQASNNIRNLGAVGLQVQGLTADGQPGILDVSSDVRDLYSLMDRVLTPQPVFTLEIAQGGQGNWATKVFSMAGEGSQEAATILIQAADNLTNNNFSKIWAQLNNNAPQPLITTSDDLSHIGYYNRDGEYHDIRELDLLAMLNTIGAKDPQLVVDYLGTLGSNEINQVRLTKRLRIFQRVAKDVHVKAYSKKYDFGGNFIEALTRAIAACGLVIGSDNALSNQENNVYNQTTANWQGSMVNPAMLRSLFQTTTQQLPNLPYNVGNLYGYGGR